MVAICAATALPWAITALAEACYAALLATVELLIAVNAAVAVLMTLVAAALIEFAVAAIAFKLLIAFTCARRELASSCVSSFRVVSTTMAAVTPAAVPMTAIHPLFESLVLCA